MVSALDFVHCNLEREFSTEQLAHQFGAAPFHFHRMFQAVTGETPMKHIRRLRLERAAVSLWASAMPITQIAYEAGYSAHEAFTRAFRRQFATSPRNTRETGRHWIGRLDSPAERDIEIVELPARELLGVPAIGSYNRAEAIFDQLLQETSDIPRSSTSILGLYWNSQDFSPPHLTRYELCVEVGAGEIVSPTTNSDPDSPLRTLRLPAATYVKVRHTGPLSELRSTFQRFFWSFLPRHDLTAAGGPTIIEYPTDESHNRAQIYVPVR